MSRGTQWIDLWDGRRWPGRISNGLPEFGFGLAPSGLSTRRQLRKNGLCRGGQEPFARLVWSNEQQFAWLYRDDQAKPKRKASGKQLAALQKALDARKVCAECGPVEHYVRTTDRLCGDCHAAGVTPARTEPAAWQELHKWQAEASNNTTDTATADNENDRPAGRGEAVAAVRRAAESARRTADSSNEPDPVRAADRDEQLARWHTDDQAADRAADNTDTDRWLQQDRGAA
jgi:hypothetical protein